MKKNYKQLTDEAREAVLVAISKLETAYWLAPDDKERERIQGHLIKLHALAREVQ